jgi:hypothetical protein
VKEDNHDPLLILEALAAAARRESVPWVDIVSLLPPRRRREPETGLRPLVVVACASLAVAGLVFLFGIALYDTMTNPLWTLVALP